ncbi:MAG: ABC transporter [Deltaproteobacteria bacterium SG8_13]|nr:MAG: ABC transporter [Deltaproteobacteria bacterium SG8_13]
MTDGNFLIQAHQLTRIYPMGRTDVIGINRLDLEIAPGELVVIKGNSGSGKSTLLSLLAGLDRPTGGGLTVAGVDLAAATESLLTRYRRSVIGMVFQNFNLLPTLTVMENACLPALLAGTAYEQVAGKAVDLLRWLGLEHRKDHLPSQLSGGELQRTAIARALINQPQIILADEPTGNLDSRNGKAVVELLAGLNRDRQRTVIIATHSNLADPHATCMIHLKDGEIAGRA